MYYNDSLSKCVFKQKSAFHILRIALKVAKSKELPLEFTPSRKSITLNPLNLSSAYTFGFAI